jgi:hypothetical protein
MPDPANLCPSCDTELAPSLLTCPNCLRLVHADRLKELAAQAEGAERADDLTSALVAWRSAVELLPANSRQHAVISTKIAALGREVDARPAVARPAGDDTAKASSGFRGSGAAGIGTLALVAWKLKAIVIIALTKGKLLLLGLTKLSTISSMAVSLGVYGMALGWRFALGLIISIYIHEMGHVWMLTRYGVKASPCLG